MNLALHFQLKSAISHKIMREDLHEAFPDAIIVETSRTKILEVTNRYLF